MSTPAVGALLLAVNYNSSAAVERMLASLADAATPPDLALRILDNSDREPLDSALAARTFRGKPGLEVLRTRENLGYFGAAAWGFEQFTRQHGTPAWTIVCNVDLVFDAGFFSALDACVGAGVIAPAVLAEKTRRDQNPFLSQRPSRLRMRAYDWLYSHPRLYAWYERASTWKSRLTTSRARATSRDIYAPHGACMVFARRYFEAGGTLRHPAFLYGEELFVAETARALNLAVHHEPALVVHHLHQVSTSALGAASRCRYLSESTHALVERYF